MTRISLAHLAPPRSAMSALAGTPTENGPKIGTNAVLAGPVMAGCVSVATGLTCSRLARFMKAAFKRSLTLISSGAKSDVMCFSRRSATDGPDADGPYTDPFEPFKPEIRALLTQYENAI